MSARYRINLLGELCVAQETRHIRHFRTQKTGALLAYLAFYNKTAHSREQLITLFWPESAPEDGRNSLSTALSSLRSRLEPPKTPPSEGLLLADRLTVRLNAAITVTDVSEFESVLHRALRADRDSPIEAQEPVLLLTDSVERYAELLPGYYEDWIPGERARLCEEFLRATLRLAARLDARKERRLALEYAHRALAVDPLREETHAALIRLYCALGEPMAALQQYDALEQMLQEQLGVAPRPELRAQVREVAARFAHGAVTVTSSTPTNDISSLPAVPAAANSSPARIHLTQQPSPQQPERSGACDRLPLPLTRFLGRTQEMARLQSMLTPVAGPAPGRAGLRSDRLVTLTGPGGVGKTRLALEVAAALQDLFFGCVWYVPLARGEGSRPFVASVAETLGLEQEDGFDPLPALIQVLTVQPALVVLDQFEQLLPDLQERTTSAATEAVQTLRTLLQQAPNLVCLVASRRRLHLSGEREFPIGPLPVPAESEPFDRVATCESVQLVVDRAQAADLDFTLTPQNADDVSTLCRHLDGLPLALELAAERISELSPAGVVRALEHRADFLVSRNPDLPLRHRSLKAILADDLETLSPEMRRFVARLAVFRGSFTAETAATCEEGDPSDATDPGRFERLQERLFLLRECSLLQPAEAIGMSEPRFRLLGTMRRFAETSLTAAEHAAARQRHAACFRRIAEQAALEMAHSASLTRLEVEAENLRAALQWFLEARQAEPGMQIATALARFWYQRGDLQYGREILGELLALPDAQAPSLIRARALQAAGLLAYGQGDRAAARRLYSESLTLLRDQADEVGVAALLDGQGILLLDEGDYARASALFAESLEIRRRLGDTRGIAAVLNNQGLAAHLQGDYAAAQALHTQSLALYREREDPVAIAKTLNNLALVAHSRGDYASARALQEESLALCRRLKDRPGIAGSLRSLALIAHNQGDLARARALYHECLAIRRELDDRAGIVYALEGIAGLDVTERMPERSARLFGAAEGLREAIGLPRAPGNRTDYDRDRAITRALLREEAFAAAFAEGRALPLEQAIALALGA